MRWTVLCYMPFIPERSGQDKMESIFRYWHFTTPGALFCFLLIKALCSSAFFPHFPHISDSGKDSVAPSKSLLKLRRRIRLVVSEKIQYDFLYPYFSTERSWCIFCMNSLDRRSGSLLKMKKREEIKPTVVSLCCFLCKINPIFNLTLLHAYGCGKRSISAWFRRSQ